MKKFRINTMALTVAAATVLVACGGGGDSVTQPVSTLTLGGTAAVGRPIVGAMVKVTCAGGSALTSQPTNGVGAWQVTLSGQTFPCAAQVTGGTINGVTNAVAYHAIGLGSGILNISPLTDLVVANMVQSATLDSWFAALNSASLTPINSTAVTNALILLIRELGLAQLGTTINPMTSTFTPTAGSVMDDTLTALNTSLANSAMSYATLRTQVSAGSTFKAPTGFVTQMGVAYGGTTSGMAAAGSGSGSPTATGKAANGTPALALANCSSTSIANQYMKCTANAVSNFATVSIVDSNDGQTCTASYSNGTLTVKKGALTTTAWINGDMLSYITTFGSGASETIETLSGYSSAGLNITMSYVTWNAAGVLKQIKSQVTVLTGGGQQLSCTQL